MIKKLILSILAQKQFTDRYQYGYGKFETIGAFALSLSLLGTGFGLSYHALELLQSTEPLAVPTNIALFAAIASILSKEVLYQFTMSIAKRNNNQVLMANAWFAKKTISFQKRVCLTKYKNRHHRSDSISSAIALVGILGAQNGFPFLDPIATILVSGLLIKVKHKNPLIFKSPVLT